LSGLGDAHLARALRRIVSASGLELDHGLPQVAYRETPRRRADRVEGVYLQQDADGLAEAFGAVEVDLLPDPVAREPGWVEQLDGEAARELPERFRPAIRTGFERALAHGPTAGYPVVGISACLVGGRYDMLCSTEEHFERAGEIAGRRALERAGTFLLEPWSHAEIELPESTVGDVIASISALRGRILGLEVRGSRAVVKALCPDRELRDFGKRLQQSTGGRGVFGQRASHYEPLPQHLVAEAVSTSPFGSRRKAC